MAFSLSTLVACGGKSADDAASTGGAPSSGGTGAVDPGTGGTGAVDPGTGGTGAVDPGTGGTGAVDPGTGGTAAGGTNSGGSPGFGGAPCAVLDQAYAQELAKAKTCNPLAFADECTTQVPDALACPCAPTFVSAYQTAALQSLSALKAQWDFQQCSDGVPCPSGVCQFPKSGVCEAGPNATLGACKDAF